MGAAPQSNLLTIVGPSRPYDTVERHKAAYSLIDQGELHLRLGNQPGSGIKIIIRAGVGALRHVIGKDQTIAWLLELVLSLRRDSVHSFGPPPEQRL